MQAPQIILICLIAFDLGVYAIAHGTPKKPHNFFMSCVDSAVLLGLLYWGGFFGK